MKATKTRIVYNTQSGTVRSITEHFFPKKKKQVAYQYARPGKCCPPPIYYYDYYGQENTILIFSADHKGLPTDMTKILAKLSLITQMVNFEWVTLAHTHC